MDQTMRHRPEFTQGPYETMEQEVFELSSVTLIRPERAGSLDLMGNDPTSKSISVLAVRRAVCFFQVVERGEIRSRLILPIYRMKIGKMEEVPRSP